MKLPSMIFASTLLALTARSVRGDDKLLSAESMVWIADGSGTRRLGEDEARRSDKIKELLSLKASMLADMDNVDSGRFTLAEEEEEPSIFETRQNGQCDFCGSTGSCGRTTSLGDSFSLSVTGLSSSSIWLVTCEFPDTQNPNCLYSPNDDSLIRIPSNVAITSALASCSETCCNYIYPRNRDSDIPSWADSRCTSSTCEYIERFCQTRSTTFRCPVGSIMFVVGEGRSARTSNAVIRAAGECSGSRTSISCSGDTLGAFVAADDCNCVRCSGSSTSFGRCRGPVVDYWGGEGYCASSDFSTCDAPSPTPPSNPTPTPPSNPTFSNPSTTTPPSNPTPSSPSSPTPSSNSDRGVPATSSDESGTSTGVIAAIAVLAAVVVLGGVGVGIFCCLRQKKENEAAAAPSADPHKPQSANMSTATPVAKPLDPAQQPYNPYGQQQPIMAHPYGQQQPNMAHPYRHQQPIMAHYPVDSTDSTGVDTSQSSDVVGSLSGTVASGKVASSMSGGTKKVSKKKKGRKSSGQAVMEEEDDRGEYTYVVDL